ncbi:MAG: septum formation protein Maf [Pedosphaera sp.]|nr:septum formation protein Maf [Pedosphaera sp.]
MNVFNHLPPVILASVSPRRSQLLRELGVEFTVLPSDAEELHNEQLTASEISQLNAHRKARAVAKHHPDALVLAADTLVYLDHNLFGKPANLDEAQGMLQRLQGKTHQVVTGVCLMHLRGHREKLFAERTNVMFRQLTPEQIHRYVTSINPLDKAGAYAIQEGGERIIRSISGSYTNVVGLPMERLAEELKAWR